jgi:hypothetical protein
MTLLLQNRMYNHWINLKFWTKIWKDLQSIAENQPLYITAQRHTRKSPRSQWSVVFWQLRAWFWTDYDHTVPVHQILRCLSITYYYSRIHWCVIFKTPRYKPNLKVMCFCSEWSAVNMRVMDRYGYVMIHVGKMW